MIKTTQNFKTKQIAQSLAVVTLLLGSATGVGYIFEHMGFPETNIVIVYILSTLITSRFTFGYVYGIAASVAATLIYNYFFTEPYFTLSVDDPSYIITFVIMTATALVTSAITSKAAKNALEAREKEAEASALYKLTNRLTDAQDISSIAETAVSVISEVMQCSAACVCFGSAGMPDSAFVYKGASSMQVWRIFPNTYEMQMHKKRIESLHSAYDITKEYYDFPIYGHEKTLGIIRIPIEQGRQLNKKQIKMLHSMVENTALAMDRYYSTKEKLDSREETEKERLRANFLRTISHDLRTPLTGISGDAKILMDNAGTLTEERKAELYADIYSGSAWLGELVENLLSITRIENDGLNINMQPELLSDVIEEALSHIARRNEERNITARISDEFLMAKMDAPLIVQVIVNLLDNALKYTQTGSDIAVTAVPDGGYARVEVADNGPGVSDAEKQKIFDMFYRAEDKRADKTGRRPGVGLGLYLSKAIIDAHGGSIYVKDNIPKGCVFGFTLKAEEVTIDE